MTMTVKCDLGGTQCDKEADKVDNKYPAKWAVLQGKRRIDLCPPCVVHANRQLKAQR